MTSNEFVVANASYKPAGTVICQNTENEGKEKYIFSVRLKDDLGNSITLDITEQINGVLALDNKRLNKQTSKKICCSLINRRVLLSNDRRIVENLSKFIPLSKNALRSIAAS